MQQSVNQRSMTVPAVLGLLLIVVGAAALVLRQVGVNVFESIGAGGWPFFVIVPGVALLAASLVPAPPRGIGFAIAGAIVTTVGSLLLYQDRTGHWESWAYAWALIPASAGLAMVLYGTLARVRDVVATGMWMVVVAGALFVAGAWYFEQIFAGNVPIADLGDWWPVAVIALGGALTLRAVLFRTNEPASSTTPPEAAPPQETRPS